eukprot:6205788-Pleurochrysis_carterae.AAC.1
MRVRRMQMRVRLAKVRTHAHAHACDQCERASHEAHVQAREREHTQRTHVRAGTHACASAYTRAAARAGEHVE